MCDKKLPVVIYTITVNLICLADTVPIWQLLRNKEPLKDWLLGSASLPCIFLHSWSMPSLSGIKHITHTHTHTHIRRHGGGWVGAHALPQFSCYVGTLTVSNVHVCIHVVSLYDLSRSYSIHQLMKFMVSWDKWGSLSTYISVSPRFSSWVATTSLQVFFFPSDASN